MNKILHIVAGMAIIGFASCSKNIDNYDGPTETLKGTFISKLTGKPVQSEIGQDNYGGSNGNGTKIMLKELSYSSNPTAQYVTGKQDGTYMNTKLFAGRYEVTPIGAFVPDAAIVDTIDIKGGTTTHDFIVEPFYEVEWVGSPVIKADGTIEAKATIIRGTNNPAFQKPINDMWLFVNTSPYIGEKAFDTRYSRSQPLGGLVDGKEFIFTSAPGQKIPSGNWYIRVGARMNYAHPAGGVKFNYSTPVKITIP